MDRQQFEALWLAHVDRLLLYATAILIDRSAAEDVLQTVCVRLLSLSAVPESQYESTYLYRAVRNEALSELRSRKRAKAILQSMLEVSSKDPQDAAQLQELGRKIESSLLDLPDDEREAIVLKIWGDLSIPAGAAVLGISEKAFEHRYYRGLAMLKERLGMRND